ncbi:phage tail protein [Turicimonas muris]|uniref:phage tail-collar fiber domain-containing protein n=1 Tax=Turicimonas muris TaxID=1796652 RepID=UPI0023F3BD4A|nr:phage tail protein [Turicimonas muris]
MTNIVITNAGLAAIVNAQQPGTNAVKIASVQFGTGKYTASANQTSLRAPFKTLAAIAGKATGDNVIQFEVDDYGTETYTVYEYGVFTEDGTLFAVYSQNTPIISKAAGSAAMLAVSCVVQGATPQTVTFGDTNLSNPIATSGIAGVVELATAEEVSAGTDNSRAVTPASLKGSSIESRLKAAEEKINELIEKTWKTESITALENSS